jgi:hypothetical protein
MADFPPFSFRPNTSASRKRGWIVLRGRGISKCTRVRSPVSNSLIRVSDQIGARDHRDEAKQTRRNTAVQFLTANRFVSTATP